MTSLEPLSSLPIEVYGFSRIPFGLWTAVQTFQRFIDDVFRSLDFVYAYVDGCSIASLERKPHIQHLDLVFEQPEL